MIAMLTLLFGASSMIFSTKQSYADVKIERDAPFRGIFIYNKMLGFLILGLLQNLEMVSVHRGENCKAWIITTEGEAAIEHLIENTNDDDDDDNCDAVATPAAA
jgi:hypothetical protein